MRTHDRLEREVAALAELARENLVAHWVKAYGCLPPGGVRRELLIRSAAWHFQAKRLSGFSPNTRRLLQAAMAAAEHKFSAKRIGNVVAGSEPSGGKDPSKIAVWQLTPGARLIREWNGRSHIVDVIESGFVFESKVFKSLSAIARQITGAHWSGPRFFGL